jgi:U3 small nucleolar RNA-associated protein 21
MSFDADDHERPKKRIKKGPNPLPHENRRLFAPFRALGFVTNHVPFAMQVRTYKGATTAPRIHILTCLGRAWAELEGEKMRLLFVGGPFFTAVLDRGSNISQSIGPNASEPISALSLHGNYVWATAGPNVLQYEAGKQASHLTLLPFGSLIST